MVFKLEISNSGGLNYLIDEKTRKSRPVFIMPNVIIPLKQKNKVVLDFTAHIFGLKEPNITVKTLVILKRLVKMTEKQIAEDDARTDTLAQCSSISLTRTVSLVQDSSTAPQTQNSSTTPQTQVNSSTPCEKDLPTTLHLQA